MAFVNLPPSLQDIFRKINDRIAKLEAGPSQAMYTAETAQGTAASAQAIAESAVVDAVNAEAAAAQALSQSSQAIQKSAQTITNAGNQLTAINASGITVYSGASASTGARVLMNSLGIVAYNASNTPTLTIDASNGSISMLGSLTSGSTVSGATITGGVIQTSSGNEAVAMLGASNALGFKNAGAYVGFIVPLSSSGIMMHYGSTPDPTGGTRPQLFIGSGNISLQASTTVVLGVSTSLGVTVSGSFSVSASATFGSSGSQFEFLSSSGNVRVAQTYNNDMGGTTRAMRVNTSGLYGYVSSTQRRKEQIENYSIDSQALLSLSVKKFKYKNDESGVQQYGFIAEEAQELGLNELIQYDSTGIPDYFAYETLPIFLLQLVQELNQRLKLLEGK
jgi:hypothetical protein